MIETHRLKNAVIFFQTILSFVLLRKINNNLNILIDPTLTNGNRLFDLAYQNADGRQWFSQFYLPNVMVKEYHVIIDKLAFFDLPKKIEGEAYEKNYRY